MHGGLRHGGWGNRSLTGVEQAGKGAEEARSHQEAASPGTGLRKSPFPEQSNS